MICKQCGEEIRRVYSIASDGEDDYIPSCGCIDWDGWIALGVCAAFVALLVLVARLLP